MIYLKEFENHSDYEEWKDEDNITSPNVSFCEFENEVHYTQFKVDGVGAVFYIQNDSQPTRIYGYDEVDGIMAADVFAKIEIDGVEVSLTELDEAEGLYQLSAGEHEIMYEFLSTSIPEATFGYGSSLFITDLVISEKITDIHPYFIFETPILKSIKVERGNAVYDSRCGCNAIIETSTNTLIKGCKNSFIPDNVTSIGHAAFYQCTNIHNIVIPNGVTEIGPNAFGFCEGMTEIILPDTLTTIGGGAFSYCTNLRDITIPSSINEISNNSFTFCPNIKKVTLNSNDIVSKDTYTTTKNISEIFGSQVTEYIIGNNVTSIGDYAFYGCTNMTDIKLSNNLISIGKYAFYGCIGLTNVMLPSLLVTIDDSAFSNCSNLTSITIPNSVSVIGESAFQRCTSLTDAVIGNGITIINYLAFFHCISLESVTIKNQTPPSIGVGGTVFYENAANRKIYVPSTSVSAYQSASGWSDYASDIEPIS